MEKLSIATDFGPVECTVLLIVINLSYPIKKYESEVKL